MKKILDIIKDDSTIQGVLIYLANSKMRGSRYLFEDFVQSYPHHINPVAVELARDGRSFLLVKALIIFMKSCKKLVMEITKS